MKNLILVILFLVLSVLPTEAGNVGSGGQIDLKDETVSQGNITTLDCKGLPVDCSVSGSDGTITVSQANLPSSNDYYVAGHTFPFEVEGMLTNPRESTDPCKLGAGCIIGPGGTNTGLYTAQDLSVFCSNSTCVWGIWAEPSGNAPTGTNASDLDMLIASANNLGLSRGNPSSEGDKLWCFNVDAGGEDRIGVSYKKDVYVHIACEHRNGRLWIWKDGVLQGSIPSGNTATMTSDLTIGYSATSEAFEGGMDDAFIANGVVDIKEVYGELENDDYFGWGKEINTTDFPNVTGCWRMNETSGDADNCEGTAARDATVGANFTRQRATGWFNNDTFSGSCPTGFNQCLGFDGTDDEILSEFENIFDFERTDAFTIEMWVKTPNITKTRGLFNKKGLNTTRAIAFYTRSSGEPRFEMWSGAMTTAIDVQLGGAAAELDDDTWKHIAVTYDGSSAAGDGDGDGTGDGVTFIIDGSVNTTGRTVNDDDLPASTILNAGPVYIGSLSGATFFEGEIDEVRIWSDVRTPTEINDNKGTECGSLGDTTGLVWCSSMNQVAGQLVLNDAPTSTIPNLGDDTNNGTSTSTPFKTCQKAVDQVPGSYGDNVTIHIASGFLLEECQVIGKQKGGDYNVTFLGYINQTANSFTDVAAKSGTTTGSNTNDFPKDAKSLFNDTGASFVNAQESSSYLEITGPTDSTGYCNATGYDYKNFYVIENVISGTQLSIITKWEDCGIPGSNNTYKIYWPKHAGTIHGANIRDEGLLIKDSSGIIIRKLGLKNHIGWALRCREAEIAEIASVAAWFNDAKQGNGGRCENSFVEEFRKNTFSSNYFGGMTFQRSYVWRANENRFSGMQNDYGLQWVYGGFAAGVYNNLAKDITGLGGYSFEQSSHTFAFGGNSSENHSANGLVVQQGSSVNILTGIHLDGSSGSNSRGISVGEFGQVTTSVPVGGDTITGDVEIENNEYGIYVKGFGECKGCTDFSYTGNTSDWNTIHSGLGTTINQFDPREARLAYILGASGNFTINGIKDPGSDGQKLTIVNRSGNNMTIAHNDAGASASDRIIIPDGADRTSTVAATAILEYGASEDKWFLLNWLD